MNQPFQKNHVLGISTILPVGKHPVELVVGQCGIFNAATNQSVVAPSFPACKAIYFGFRLPAMETGQLSFNSANPYYSVGIPVNKITNFRGRRGHRGQNEKVAIGFDGVDTTKTLAIAAGQTKSLYILLDGSPITKLDGNQGLMLRYDTFGGCTDACADGCTDAHCGIPMQDLVKQINEDHRHHGFIRASELKSCSDGDAVVTEAWTCYTLILADAGDDVSTSIVGAQYPGTSVVRVSRDGIYSTYKLCQITSAGAPTDFSTGNIISIPNCSTCPAGYEFRSGHIYEIKAEDAGDSTALSHITGNYNIQAHDIIYRTSYINGVSTYLIVSDYAFNLDTSTVNEIQTMTATGASAGTFTLTFDGQTTAAIAYNAAAAAIQTALDNLSNVAVNGIVVANAGTADANNTTFTFSHTDYAGQNVPMITVDLDGLTGPTGGVITQSTASKIINTYGTVISGTTVLISATYLGVTDNWCFLTTATTTAWTAGDTGVRYARNYTMTLADTECGTDRLAELVAAYGNIGTVTIVTPGDCAQVYKLVVYSNFVEEGCFPSEATWPVITGYGGGTWALDTSADLGTCSCGILIEAAVFNRYNNECTYGTFTNDFDGIHIRVSHFDNNYNGTPSVCTNEWPVTKLQAFAPPINLGAQLKPLEEATLLDLYRGYSNDPGVRQAEGFTLFAKSDTVYDTYTVDYTHSYSSGQFSDVIHNRYSEHFHFPAGEGKGFEQAMNTLIASANLPIPPVVL